MQNEKISTRVIRYLLSFRVPGRRAERMSDPKNSVSNCNRELPIRNEDPCPPMSDAKPKTVLMIDDDAALASMLKRFVEKYGYRLVHAGHPKQGLLELERSKPVAVLLDI